MRRAGERVRLVRKSEFVGHGAVCGENGNGRGNGKGMRRTAEEHKRGANRNQSGEQDQRGYSWLHGWAPDSIRIVDARA